MTAKRLDKSISVKLFRRDILLELFKNEDYVQREEDILFDNLFVYLNNLECKKLIVERNYVDRDYLDDYTRYYATCFKEVKGYPRFCKRIHFFKSMTKSKINEVFTDIHNESLIEQIQKDYLGYIVVKPLPQTVIGRTILKSFTDNTENENMDLKLENKPFIKCLREYHSNIYGIDLKINSIAFQEQDTVTSACATSALWTALQKVTYLFHNYTPTPSEITNCATKYMQFTRTIPSPGLTIEQICQAINEIGLEPDIREYFEEKDKVKLPILSYIYSYLRAGLPVILALKIEDILHASTIIGFQISPESKINNELGSINKKYESLKLKGSRITKLYAHDDQIGPFSELKVKSNKDGKPIFLENTTFKNGGKPIPIKPTDVIIPLYHKIRVPMISLLRHIYRLVRIISPLQIIPNNKVGIEWDIYLTWVNKFKKEFLKNRYKGCFKIKEILFDSYPRFFWRCIAYNGNIRLFELLGDATDMERSCQIFKIIFYNGEFRGKLKNKLNNVRISKAVEEIISKPLKRRLYKDLDINPTR